MADPTPMDPENRPTDLSLPEGETSAAIGPYRLLHKLGEGGMGEVWLAEQSEPVRRRVALKVIKPGMDSRQVVARFEAERQALAMMDHPAIARVFDAGATSGGRPYFVMENIQGVPITEHCDRLKLSTSERLALFVQVCEGVQHAHQKAVIHRDLKPSNVLVTVQDGRALPKIIDFGVAKATAHRLTEKTMFTELGALIGTPEYMSPEQAEMTGQDVDTRTDVYSLGVLLYELLVGALPFDPQELRKEGFSAIVRKIREDDPPRPSTRLSTLGGERSTTAARDRGADPRTLRNQLRGDLDWIVMKAIEKDRGRRYGSPADLASDVLRHLSLQPVLAGPPSAAYRARKFVQRHRVGVGAAAVAVLALLGFAVTMAVQAGRIAAERDRADRERQASDRVSAFMANILGSVKPQELGGALWEDLRQRVAEARRKGGADPAQVETALRSLDEALAGVSATGAALTLLDEQILDRAGRTIETDLAQEPRIAGRLEHTLAETYNKLGLAARAEPHAERAVELREATLGPDHRDTLHSRNTLGAVYLGQGRFEEAGRLFQETFEARRRIFGPEDVDTLGSMTNLAAVAFNQGRYAEAEALWKGALEVQRRVLGPDDIVRVKTLGNLAAVTVVQGRNEEAMPLLEEAVATRRRVLGAEDPETLVAMGNLASVYGNLGRNADAERLFQETLEVQRRVLGPTHPYTLASLQNVALTHTRQGRWAKGEALLAECLENDRRALGENHPETLKVLMQLARARAKLGREAEAEAMLARTLARQRQGLGDAHPDVAQTMLELGIVAAGRGRQAEALDWLTRYVDHEAAEPAAFASEDLASLRGVQAFDALADRARGKAAKAE